MYALKKNKYEEFSENRLHDFLDLIEKKNKKLTFVEFGAGSGLTLKGIKKKYTNSEVYGFDIEPANDGHGIFKEDLNRFKFIKYKKILNKTDYFLLLDVLEHLNDPMDFLKNLTKYTKKNAVIIISCPNFLSLRMLFAWIRGVLPKEHHGYFDESHLHWFSPVSFYDFFKEININNLTLRYLFSKKYPKKLFQKIYPMRLCSQFIFVVKI
jgi:2-polyprenyl-3-methyl-5-hydroxy-6-metoxy-1,4-benzoquinol methylase